MARRQPPKRSASVLDSMADGIANIYDIATAPGRNIARSLSRRDKPMKPLPPHLFDQDRFGPNKKYPPGKKPPRELMPMKPRPLPYRPSNEPPTVDKMPYFVPKEPRGKDGKGRDPRLKYL